LLDVAFALSSYEALLVEFTRKSNQSWFEWVSEIDGKIVGELMFTVALKGDSPIEFHLAPVAVAPEYQRKGIGSLRENASGLASLLTLVATILNDAIVQLP